MAVSFWGRKRGLFVRTGFPPPRLGLHGRQIVEEELALWEEEGHAFLRRDFDPGTGRRRRIAMTSAAGRIFGAHREEVRPPMSIRAGYGGIRRDMA